jgi:hypothetical protein
VPTWGQPPPAVRGAKLCLLFPANRVELRSTEQPRDLPGAQSKGVVPT